MRCVVTARDFQEINSISVRRFERKGKLTRLVSVRSYTLKYKKLQFIDHTVNGDPALLHTSKTAKKS